MSQTLPTYLVSEALDSKDFSREEKEVLTAIKKIFDESGTDLLTDHPDNGGESWPHDMIVEHIGFSMEAPGDTDTQQTGDRILTVTLKFSLDHGVILASPEQSVDSGLKITDLKGSARVRQHFLKLLASSDKNDYIASFCDSLIKKKDARALFIDGGLRAIEYITHSEGNLQVCPVTIPLADFTNALDD